MRSFGRVASRASQRPVPNIRTSTPTVAPTLFQSPRPSFGPPPGQSGMSGRWLTKSRNQWLTTSAASTQASSFRRFRQKCSAPKSAPQITTVRRLCEIG